MKQPQTGNMYPKNGSRVFAGVLASLALVGGPLSGCGETTQPKPTTHTTKKSDAGGAVASAGRDNERVILFRTHPPLLSLVDILVCVNDRLEVSTVRQFPIHDGFEERTSLQNYDHSPECDGNYLSAEGLKFKPTPLPLHGQVHKIHGAPA